MEYTDLIFSDVVKKTIDSQIKLNITAEFALLATSDIQENKIIVTDIFYISTEKIGNYQAILPRYEQLLLLKYCMNTNEIPTIIHSHVSNKSLFAFSIQDDLFEKALSNVSLKIGGNSQIISILFMNNKIRLRTHENSNFHDVTNFSTNYYE